MLVGMTTGDRSTSRAVAALAELLPEPLEPLARIAYNYWWSWAPGGEAVFADLAPEEWRLARHNPVRLLTEAPHSALEAAAADAGYIRRVADLATRLEEALAAGTAPSSPTTADRPVAFLCAEFGVHRSLPIYSGGLGVLAGDILKAASDRRLPMVAVGLMYRSGYFHQRLDRTGWQHEYWTEIDPAALPAVLVTDEADEPLEVPVPVWGTEVPMHLWRVEVGRVPLYLLDADAADNGAVERWITSRLYESSRAIRLAQYAALGIGGVRALRAVGVDPGVIHLNEGHAALAILETAAELVDAGQTFEKAVADVGRRVVFTTHTPVAAGNETYDGAEILEVMPDLAPRVALDPEELLDLGRTRGGGSEPAGLTPLAIRLSRGTNGVSRRHGEVAREMWRPLFAEAEGSDQVPITHITNGVHVPTWVAPAMRDLLDRHLGEGWIHRADDPATWEAVDDVPDEELWDVRNRQRAALVAFARERTITDRLRRGERLDYVRAAAEKLDGSALTLGFARRLATYKRLRLLAAEPGRAVELLEGPRAAQILFAGKAHPDDEGGKELVRELFRLKAQPGVGSRVAFLEDYDLEMAHPLVAGCDVWLNLPRPPLEASGTSGMKAILNGGLHLSVLDGWWAEGYDGDNGWAIDGEVGDDPEVTDQRHAEALYRLLEEEVVPMFHERDEHGIPRRWLAMVKRSLRTLGPQFSAARMLADYEREVYPSP